jgi:hypothetical protein
VLQRKPWNSKSAEESAFSSVTATISTSLRRKDINTGMNVLYLLVLSEFMATETTPSE